MLYYALVFLIVAIVAALLGFGAIAFRGRGNREDPILRVPDPVSA
jgi:hypothetical protein